MQQLTKTTVPSPTIHETQAEYLRIKDLIKFLPFSEATIWRKSKKGEFPAPKKLSEGVTAWKTIEVKNWLKGKEAA